MGRTSRDSEQQVELLRREKRRANSNNDLVAEANIRDELGQALSLQGCYEEAIEEHLADLRLRDSLSDVVGRAVSNRRIGECYTERKMFEEALRYLVEYLRLSRECSSLVEEQRAWATLGRTYLIQSEEKESINERRKCLEKAENAFVKSLELCQSLEGDVSVRELCQMKARLHLNLGLVHDNARELSKAAKHLKKSASLSSLHSLTDDLYKAQSSLVLTLMKMQRDQWPLADKTSSMAIITAQQSNSRSIEAEAQIIKAKVKLFLRDFVAAKRYLKKAHQLSKDEKAGVMKLLDQVIRLERLHNSSVDADNLEKKAELLEKMADKAARYQLIPLAIDGYAVTLKLYRDLQKPACVLGPLYYSLAQTYADDLQHENAIKYYQAELQCQVDQPTKACRTLLRIALEQENCAKGYVIVRETYKQALAKAELAVHPKLQARCLKYLIQLQRINNESTIDTTKLHSLIDEYNLDLHELSEDDDSEEIVNSSNSESDEDIMVDLDDISDCDAEEELDHGKGRRRRSLPVKKNAKGESLLHVACIEGNVKKVETLLKKDHPVSVHDNCGWTPLHEACNHGHLEIVDILLNHGANINDAGGDMTDGITPLHDACTAGNVEVIEMLIDRGADVFSRDKKGNTPLDTLNEYCERSDQRDLTVQQITDIRRVHAQLYRSITGDNSMGRRYLPPLDMSENLPVFVRKSTAPASDNYPDVGHDETRAVNQIRNAEELYRSTIKSLGTSAQRLGLKTPTRSTGRIDPGALVDASDFVDDDWLVEDVKDTVKRRRPVDIDQIFPPSDKKRKTESKKSRYREDITNEIFNRVRDGERSRSDIPTNTIFPDHNVTNELECANELDDTSFIDIFDQQETSLGTREKHAEVIRSEKHLQSSSANSDYVTPSGLPMVLDSTMRMDYMCDDTMAQRYYLQHSRHTELSLSMEGAALSDTERVVLEDPTNVFGGRSERSMVLCYEDNCASLSTVTYKDIKDRLDWCTKTRHLLLDNLNLRTKQLRPLIMTLRQNQIHTLKLSGNRIESTTLFELITSLSHISVLDLSLCQIDHVGFVKFTSGLKLSTSRYTLTSLNLNYNCLSDVCAPSVIELLETGSKLTDLSIAGCRLTQDFIMNRELAFSDAFKESALLNLNLSDNRFGRDGVKILLRVLPHKIRSLNLARTTDMASKINVVLDLHLFLSQAILEELNITGCGLTNEETDSLINALPQCERLTTLYLSNNNIGPEGIRKLLENCMLTPLQNLHLVDCGLNGPLDSCLTDCIMSKMGSTKPLHALSFTCFGLSRTEIDSLVRIWTDIWNDRTRKSIKKHKISLWITEDQSV